MNLRTIENLYARAKSYAERNGLADLLIRSGEGVKDSFEDYFYDREVKSRLALKEAKAELPVENSYKISLLIPAYNTRPGDLKRLLKSLSRQKYRNFETIIADASDEGKLKNLIDEFCDSDENNTQIVYLALDENKGISEIQRNRHWKQL